MPKAARKARVPAMAAMGTAGAIDAARKALIAEDACERPGKFGFVGPLPFGKTFHDFERSALASLAGEGARVLAGAHRAHARAVRAHVDALGTSPVHRCMRTALIAHETAWDAAAAGVVGGIYLRTFAEAVRPYAEALREQPGRSATIYAACRADIRGDVQDMGMIDSHVCECGGVRERDDVAAMDVCVECTAGVPSMDTAESGSAQYAAKTCPYSRPDQFMALLNSVQGIEIEAKLPADIEAVTMNVGAALREAQVRPEDVSVDIVHTFIRRLGLQAKQFERAGRGSQINYSRYYSKVPYIFTKLMNVKLERLSEAEMRALYQMFLEIVHDYWNFESTRKTFLSYRICVYRMLQSRGHLSMLKNVILLKDGATVQKQDDVLKRIFRHRGWPFPEWGLGGDTEANKRAAGGTASKRGARGTGRATQGMTLAELFE